MFSLTTCFSTLQAKHGSSSSSKEESGFRLITKYKKMLFKTSSLAFQQWSGVFVSWSDFVVYDSEHRVFNFVAHPRGQTKAHHSSWQRVTCSETANSQRFYALNIVASKQNLNG